MLGRYAPGALIPRNLVSRVVVLESQRGEQSRKTIGNHIVVAKMEDRPRVGTERIIDQSQTASFPERLIGHHVMRFNHRSGVQ